jgi:serine/threonine protein kinase
MDSAANYAFLATLRRSCLLSNEQLARAKQILAQSGGTTVLSGELVRRQWLTAWQLRQLQDGHTRFRCADYTLLDVLGRGNMGIVYKARHRSSGRVVAFKVMSGRAAASDRQSARFQREIRLVTAIRSPHVVRALDSGRIAGRDFLIMEFIRGRTLDWWIGANRRLPIRWVCECARQVAIGLQHVHESGLIHRDIKPSNIIVSGNSLDQRPRARILDLGLGRFAGQCARGDDLTRDGQTVGTLDYMAPEQLQDNRLVDIRSDIYALGCTLFEALTGRQPFEGSDLGEKMLAKLTGEPVPAESFREDAPGELRDLIIQMMCRSPEGRPANPRNVAEALREFSIREHVNSGQEKKSQCDAARHPLPKSIPRSTHFGRHVADTVKTLKSRFLSLFARVRFVRWRRLRTSE